MLTLKIASAQLNAHVGALAANMEKAREAYARAKADGADILVLPEQFVIGYPASHLADQGAEILISPNGSPWRRTALTERVEALGEKVHNEGLPLIYVNQIGGQDELVFDGSSFSMDADGKIVPSIRTALSKSCSACRAVWIVPLLPPLPPMHSALTACGA